MKRERRPNEYMDLEEEHRLSEEAAAKFKPIPPWVLRWERWKRAYRGENFLEGMVHELLLAFLLELIAKLFGLY